MTTHSPRRFALIGFGGIARSVLEALQADEGAELACAAVLVRAPARDEAQTSMPAGARAVCTLEELFATAPDIVVDCAGHGALREYGAAILRAGYDLLSVSSGALSDPALERALGDAAAKGGRLLFAAGALAGIDGLAAAQQGGLEWVRYRGVKPVRAWRGTPAEQLLDLDSLQAPTVFFQGSAREAAARYPANANVTATVALAGLGFERTEVSLVADPQASENLHELSYAGAFGSARIEVRGRPSPQNPKTSMLTALSVWRALRDETVAAIRPCLPGSGGG